VNINVKIISIFLLLDSPSYLTINYIYTRSLNWRSAYPCSEWDRTKWTQYVRG